MRARMLRIGSGSEFPVFCSISHVEGIYISKELQET